MKTEEDKSKVGKAELDNVSFYDEVQNTCEHFYKTLNRANDLERTRDDKRTPLNLHDLEDERKRAEVLQRIFLTMGGAGLEVQNPATKEWVAARSNNLPLAMEFAVGPRILIEIPKVEDPGKVHEFFNWLSSGNLELGSNITQETRGGIAKDQGRVIYTRPAATHGIAIKNGHVEELKSNPAAEGIAAATKYFKYYSGLSGSDFFTGHFGMDVGVGGYGEVDTNGKTVRPDGATGHLYMYYYPPTATEPGGLLVGMEGCAPGVQGQYGSHSLLGASDEKTTAGGRQSKELATMPKDGEYERSFIADRYNGRRIILTSKAMKDLYEFDFSNIQDKGEMALLSARSSVREFVTDLSNAILPEYDFKQSNIYTLDVICSPLHAKFVPLDLKKSLHNSLMELAKETPSKSNEELARDYKSLFDKLLQHKEFTRKHADEFRESVEEYIAAAGRNRRYNLVHNIHTQVYKEKGFINLDESLQMVGVSTNMSARALNATSSAVSATASVLGAASTAVQNLWSYGWGAKKPVIIDEISQLSSKPKDDKAAKKESNLPDR